MKRRFTFVITALLLCAGANWAAAQGTAFTYQGQLTSGGSPASGLFDLTFNLYDTNSGGSAVTAPVALTSVGVTNGLFTVTLNFYGIFYSAPGTYWLDLQVRPSGTGSFTELTPRQPITPTPYSIYSEFANFADNLPDNSVGTVNLRTTTSPNVGQVLVVDTGGLLGWTNLPTNGSGGAGWSLTGNAGTTPGVNFLGTTDDNVLQMKVDGVRGWQMQPTGDSPSVIGGAPGNFVAGGIVGATIGGGGTITLYGAAYTNSVWAYHGTIGGGLGNTIQTLAYESTIAGGNQNTIQGGAFRSAIGGGYLNGIQSNADESVIGGGAGNNASGVVSVVGGGLNNSNFSYAGTIGGGLLNSANSTTGGFFSGGATVAGGSGNNASTDQTTVGGGYLNKASALFATVPGGLDNVAGGTGSFAAGQYAQTTNVGSFIWSDGSETPFTGAGYDNGFNVLASGGVFFYTSPTQRLEVNDNFVQIDGANADDGNGPIEAYIGGNGSGSDVQVGSMNPLITSVAFYNWGNSTWMHISCSEITINGGSDLAEPFEISSAGGEIPQGSVVVIDDQNPGHLKISQEAYDTRVAGVISGANGVNPGIQMRQQGTLDGGKNVALTGRVYVLADAAGGAIRPGDLLTTSRTPGHAMKVTDHAKAQGAILGKAMTALNEGQGMVLVLVTLQ